MAREKRDFRKDVEEGVQEHEHRKNIRKKNSLSKVEFQKSNVQLTPKQNDLYKAGVLTKEEFEKAKKKILN